MHAPDALLRVRCWFSRVLARGVHASHALYMLLTRCTCISRVDSASDAYLKCTSRVLFLFLVIVGRSGKGPFLYIFPLLPQASIWVSIVGMIHTSLPVSHLLISDRGPSLCQPTLLSASTRTMEWPAAPQSLPSLQIFSWNWVCGGEYKGRQCPHFSFLYTSVTQAVKHGFQNNSFLLL